MTDGARDDDALFSDAIRGLEAGDFSRLEPMFRDDPVRGGSEARIVDWVSDGRFDDRADALAEAMTCACFLGSTRVVAFLLARGLDPSVGARTGLDGVHWAANRGQLETLNLLLDNAARLETRNMYGGTVLGTAVWSAVNEPKPHHLQIIERLIKAGARLDDVGYPRGNSAVDDVLERHGARS